MLPTVNPTHTTAWKTLSKHYEQMKDVHMKDLFAAEPDRFQNFSLKFENILLDYSKNRITQETMDTLLQLAEECKLKEAIEAMFSGEHINQTEDRAVLHVALRNLSDHPVSVDGKNVMP